MSGRKKQADPHTVWQRLWAIVQADTDLVDTLLEAHTDLVDTLLDARKSFRELGVEVVWNKFERRLLRRLDDLGLKHIKRGNLSQAFGREVEELRTWLVLNVYGDKSPAAEVAPALVVRRVAGNRAFGIHESSLQPENDVLMLLDFPRTNTYWQSTRFCLPMITGRQDRTRCESQS